MAAATVLFKWKDEQQWQEEEMRSNIAAASCRR